MEVLFSLKSTQNLINFLNLYGFYPISIKFNRSFLTYFTVIKFTFNSIFWL